MIPAEWLDEAAVTLANRVQTTPLTHDPEWNLYLKWENQQTTGSFKLRGAVNKVLSLLPWEQQRGLVAASAGNHGQGVAWAAKQVGAPVIIFASDHAVPAKVDAMRALGAEVRLVPGGYELAEQTAQQYALEHNQTWISPYNDARVIAGQSTLAMETIQQVPEIPEICLVPVGGGGLIAGFGLTFSRLARCPRLVGVQSEASPFFHAIFHQGSQQGVTELPSLADGLSGAVEEGSITVPIVKNYVDDLVLVHEEDVEQAIAVAWQRWGQKIEGSAAVALAAILNGKVPQRPALVILTGGNIQPEIHRQILAKHAAPRED